jgi:hypothetical protein
MCDRDGFLAAVDKEASAVRCFHEGQTTRVVGAVVVAGVFTLSENDAAPVALDRLGIGGKRSDAPKQDIALLNMYFFVFHVFVSYLEAQ